MEDCLKCLTTPVWFSDAGYSVLMTGVNESAVILPLAPGETYDLVFSPVDYVGNRQTPEDAIKSNGFQLYVPAADGRL